MARIDVRQVLEVALPGLAGCRQLVCQRLGADRVVDGGTGAVGVRRRERRRAVELVVILDAEIGSADVGHIVGLARMRDTEVVRRQSIAIRQCVDVRGQGIADDRAIAGVFHHDLDDVLVVGHRGPRPVLGVRLVRGHRARNDRERDTGERQQPQDNPLEPHVLRLPFLEDEQRRHERPHDRSRAHGSPSPCRMAHHPTEGEKPPCYQDDNTTDHRCGAMKTSEGQPSTPNRWAKGTDRRTRLRRWRDARRRLCLGVGARSSRHACCA